MPFTHPQPYAVIVNDVTYEYSNTVVLNNVSVQVKTGTIYALVGPSGCGKTKLLKCIINQLEPSSGHVNVLGCKPGSNGSTVPGIGVGYMPQDTALYDKCTVTEILHFFAYIR